MSAQQNARNSVLSKTFLEIATRAQHPRTSPTMVSILVLTTAFVAPPVTVHRHRVNELHINALADVNLLIEAAVGIFGAGFAGWKMSQDGKDAEPSAAITAKMPPLDGKVVSSWYDSGMRLTSEAKVMVTSATEATVVTASWYDAGKRLGGEAVSSEPKAIKTPMRNVKTILSKPMPPPGFVWAEDLADAAPATPPAKPVVSWYDSGKRLSSPVTVATKTASTQVEWPALGGSGAFHPMRGPWPKAPAREQWTPPPGWKPPSKPVTSWYDRGDRLTSTVTAKATAVAPAPIDPAEMALAESIAASTVALLSPANALTYLSGAATRQSLIAKGVSLDAINEATAVVREAVASMPKEWPALGGSGAFHPMRGPWPKAPAREQWTPPPGWIKPSKPVSSWYDKGDRLTSTVAKTASTQVEWPALGGSGAFHPMRGPWPKAPAREQWTPPPGWIKPSKPVLSWYDKGERLTSAVAMMAAEATPYAQVYPGAYPALGGSGAFHPMRGPWPKAPAREQWTPPPGWKPPSKPVTSWYDRGDRLTSTVTKTASTQVEWPALGGSGAFHPMRGPWPKAPAREQWTPPPGWIKPSKPVLSWYDKGERLSSQQAPIIQATKANIMPKGGWVVSQPDGSTEQVGWSTGMPSETSLATPGSPNRAPQFVLLGAMLGGAFLAARSFGIRMP